MRTKIKTIAAILFIALTITSCKKTYSCACTSKVTDPSTGGVVFTKTDTQPIDEKMKSKQATAACNQTAQQITDNLYDVYASGYDVVTSCDIK